MGYMLDRWNDQMQLIVNAPFIKQMHYSVKVDITVSLRHEECTD